MNLIKLQTVEIENSDLSLLDGNIINSGLEQTDYQLINEDQDIIYNTNGCIFKK